MMECIDAQRVISDALDRVPQDAHSVAEAKEHCRTCAECSAFVRTLRVVRETPLPAPPADLVDRVMAGVRAEADRTRAAAARVGASPVESGAKGTSSALPAPARPRFSLSNPRSLATLAGAAAAFLVGVSILSYAGVRIMTGSGGGEATLSSRTTATDSKSAGVAVPAPATAPQTAETSAVAGNSAATGAAAPQDITLNGVVYASSGAATVDRAQLRDTGVVTTALGSGAAPVQRRVYTGIAADTVYVADDTDQILAFKKVMRSYAGATYVLMSGEISQFGVYPTLPTSIPAPASVDGSPVFVEVGPDAAGVKIYRQAALTTAQGIAIPPNTPTTDPAAGNPSWTWWVPAR